MEWDEKITHATVIHMIPKSHIGVISHSIKWHNTAVKEMS